MILLPILATAWAGLDAGADLHITTNGAPNLVLFQELGRPFWLDPSARARSTGLDLAFGASTEDEMTDLVLQGVLGLQASFVDGASFSADGTLVRMGWEILGDQQISLCILPVSSGDLLLGNTPSLAWGDTEVWSQGPERAPAARIGWQAGESGVYGAAKAYLLPDENLSDNLRLGLMAGGRLSLGPALAELGYGVFPQGEITVVGLESPLLGDPVEGRGGNVSLGLRSSKALGWVRWAETSLLNDRLAATDAGFTPPESPEDLEALVQVEGARKTHDLIDNDATSRTREEAGRGLSGLGFVRKGALEVGLQGSWRDLAWIQFGTPGFFDAFAIPEEVEQVSEIQAGATVAGYLDGLHLRLGGSVGAERPAAYALQGVYHVYDATTPRAQNHAPEWQPLVVASARWVPMARVDGIGEAWFAPGAEPAAGVTLQGRARF